MPVCSFTDCISYDHPDCPLGRADRYHESAVVCCGYELAEVGTKKEDDLFHLLNLVCLKYTGHYLPADGETANIHKYIVCDGKKLCITPPRNPLSIMSYATDNSLAHQVKRAMIGDKIKKMYEYQEFYPTIIRQLAHNDKFFNKLKSASCRASNTSLESLIEEATAFNSYQRTMRTAIKSGIKEIAYEILMGSNDDPTLLPLMRKFGNHKDYFADLTDKDKCVSYLMTTPCSKNRISNRYTQLSSCKKELDKLLRHFGSGYTAESTQDFLKSQYLDAKYYIDNTISKGVGDTHITKANKIRKGKEYDVFRKMMDSWGLGFWIGDVSPYNLIRSLLPTGGHTFHHHYGGTFTRSLSTALQRIGNHSRLFYDIKDILLPDGQLSEVKRKGYWRSYKMDSGSLSSDYFIKMATGKTNDIDVEGKLVSMFC